MHRPNPLPLVALLAAALAAGCADGSPDQAATAGAGTGYAHKAPGEKGDEAKGDVELGDAIDNVSVVENVELTAGATVEVPYEPAAKAYDKKAGVPYLGIAIGAARAAAADSEIVDVTVEGDFPGSPEVLVTDAELHVLARGTATTHKSLDRVSVELPLGRGSKFILVRDQLWTKPMTFDVSAGR